MTFSIREWVLELGVLLLNFLAWRFFRFEDRRARLAIRSVLFAVLSYVLWTSSISPLSPSPWADDPPRHFLALVLCLLWWLQAAQISASTLGIFLLPAEFQRDHLFRDVLHAAIYLVAGFLAIAYVLNMPIGGLIATSGALAIIFGLAVQSTLTDAFSGVVLKATQPFINGDMVAIGDVKGQVVESNWRAMTLLNGQGNLVVIPNSTVAKASIINESRPPLMHGLSVSVRVSSAARPSVVLAALEDALQGTPGLLANPAPVASARTMGRRFVEYEVLAYVDSETGKRSARNEFIDQAYRQLAAHGVEMRQDAIEKPQQPFVKLLRGVEMFQELSDEQFAELASDLSREAYDPGQIIYDVSPTCPDERRALCIVASGVAVSLVPHAGQDVELRRLLPGDAIGRAGVLTGVSTGIKLRAVSKVVVVRLKKDALTPILKAHPEIGKDMLNCLLDYQAKVAEIDREIPANGDGHESLMHRLLDGMRRLHGLFR